MSARIDYEEKLLVRFFGLQYEKYVATVPVGIPFINGLKSNLP